ncbi:hypothetical protein FT673_21140 [Aeromonas hydrophila]|nr:hypothetical protein FT673_21140 [Aeromonas hydrophila]
MTSWVMWEIWWSRVWGEAEMDGRAGEHEPEVAHEPARLPAELIAHRSKASASRPRAEAFPVAGLTGA